MHSFWWNEDFQWQYEFLLVVGNNDLLHRFRDTATFERTRLPGSRSVINKTPSYCDLVRHFTQIRCDSQTHNATDASRAKKQMRSGKVECALYVQPLEASATNRCDKHVLPWLKYGRLCVRQVKTHDKGFAEQRIERTLSETVWLIQFKKVNRVMRDSEIISSLRTAKEYPLIWAMSTRFKNHSFLTHCLTVNASFDVCV